MNRVENLFIKIFSLIVVTLSSAACFDEEILKQVQGDGILSFAINDENSTVTSRSVEDTRIYPVLGLQVFGNDSLYFHTDVTDYEILKERVASRGIPIGSENFDDEVDQIVIDAFVDNNPFFTNYPIIKQSGTIWNGSDKRYWPGDKSIEVDFYASAKIADGVEIKHENGVTRMDYEVPNSNGKLTDAEVQPDIILGYSKCSYEYVSKNFKGNVPMKMHHALAAVSFKVGDFRKGTIKSITISNARKKGSLAYTQGVGTDIDNPVMDWSIQDELTDFTQTFNIDVEDGAESAITAQRSETTFMLLPQDLEADGVMFIVEFEYEENGIKQDITLTAPVVNAGDNKTWEAGRHYIYIHFQAHQ